MKKVILAALCVAVLGLVGCSYSDKPETTSYKETQSEVDADHGKKCTHKKCKKAKGKLGEEKMEKDTTK